MQMQGPHCFLFPTVLVTLAGLFPACCASTPPLVEEVENLAINTGRTEEPTRLRSEWSCALRRTVDKKTVAPLPISPPLIHQTLWWAVFGYVSEVFLSPSMCSGRFSHQQVASVSRQSAPGRHRRKLDLYINILRPLKQTGEETRGDEQGSSHALLRFA
ncbi:hypothetical protein B0J12DRAFT_319338 [Macrophomina phaseolina]|uniref:Secreted protein n=1 Tax=Macrophomina phaseolina TaxID=35725 RepID=A0ABQ8FZ29_9PEZI|nr:hypothetical protein B0J12DRAFT_319338 [Macrophomina phaseolina]